MNEAIIKRFWSHVDKSGDCWMWTGSKGSANTQSPLAYGQFGVSHNGRLKSYRAHRLSWMLHNGDIPDGKIVMHDCDVPLCVKPDHLRLGTHLDNVRDRDRKGRCQQGETHYDSRLTPDQVLAIFDDKKTSNSELGRRYGVHNTNIMKIRQGRNWKRLLREAGRISDSLGQSEL